MKILLLDNYDSFTYNLLHIVRETGADADVFRNDKIELDEVEKYDKILLVGGSTFMPQVKMRLEQEFPGTPIEFCDPNESVARGAAIYGQNLEAYQKALEIAEQTGKKVEEVVNDTSAVTGGFGLPGGKKPVVVKNVVSKSYALQMVDANDELHLYNKIFKNSAIPLEVAVHAGTQVDNQTSVQLSVYENDYPKGASEHEIVKDEDATLLISDELKPLPDGLKAGSPIDVILKIDEQGLLSVDAKDVTGGRTVHMEVKLKNVMSIEEEQKAKEQVKNLKMM